MSLPEWNGEPAVAQLARFRHTVYSGLKCNTALGRDGCIDVLLFEEGLQRRLEVEVFSGSEVVHPCDVLQLFLGDFVEIGLPWQVASDVLHRSLLP